MAGVAARNKAAEASRQTGVRQQRQDWGRGRTGAGAVLGWQAGTRQQAQDQSQERGQRGTERGPGRVDENELEVAGLWGGAGRDCIQIG